MLAHLITGPEVADAIAVYITSAEVAEAELQNAQALLKDIGETMAQIERDIETGLRDLLARIQRDGGQAQAALKPAELFIAVDAALVTLIAERDEARTGYHALDKNWETHHDRCMLAISEAVGLPTEATVPELCEKIRRMRARVS